MMISNNLLRCALGSLVRLRVAVRMSAEAELDATTSNVSPSAQAAEAPQG
jgi:hypothetical protein